MKTQPFLAVFVLVITFLSCKKTEMIPPPAPTVDVTKLTDSCYYILDGVTYICNQMYSQGRGNAGANLDTTNRGWKWDADTLQYHVSYGISSNPNSPAPGGDITLSLVKKFAKNQLTRDMSLGMVGPPSDTVLYYPKGERQYAVDFSRFNSQNGVVLKVKKRIGNTIQEMRTHSSEMVSLPTTITDQSQKNSRFEITNVYFVPAGNGYTDRHILEVKFKAVLFDGLEKPHYLENGYIRIHVE